MAMRRIYARFQSLSIKMSFNILKLSKADVKGALEKRSKGNTRNDKEKEKEKDKIGRIKLPEQ